MSHAATIKRLEAMHPRKRMYQNVWELIEKNRSTEPVKVVCPGPGQARLIQAVRKEKSMANMQRKNVDATNHGRLIVKVEGRNVFFSLVYNGDVLMENL